MIKRALKKAIGPSLGIMIGNVIFRLIYPDLYNETWPNIYMYAALYLIVGYAACFLVALLIEAGKSKLKQT